jgi:hypothetical protein
VTGHPIVKCQSDCHSLVTSQRTVSYAVDMTTKGLPGRVIRIDDETWADYGKACEEKGIARAADIRMYVKREVAAWRKEQQKRQRDVNAARNIAES